MKEEVINSIIFLVIIALLITISMNTPYLKEMNLPLRLFLTGGISFGATLFIWGVRKYKKNHEGDRY